MSILSWFNKPGAYVMVDGQFGSTGKGLLASYISAGVGPKIDVVTTNAGPNSGHTAFWNGTEIMTQQLPVAGVCNQRAGHHTLMYLNAGAVIDADILAKEMDYYLQREMLPCVAIHPRAAKINDQNRKDDKIVEAHVAGTGKGVGPAIVRKIMRESDAVWGASANISGRPWDNFWGWEKDRVLVETAQGFSLGINSRFYPHTTSRECTVGQAIADARIPAQKVRKVVATFRTYPIRVGNTTTGYSGDGYNDQEETTWEALNLKPELTTVTKRVRRVFTWSRRQFKECVAVNQPDVIFLNFCNYLEPSALRSRLETILEDYYAVMRRNPDEVLGGFSPRLEDIRRLFARKGYDE